MNIRTVKFEQLTGVEIAAWSAIQRGHLMFSSPYFRPEFTQAVASVRDDVQIAVLEDAGSPVGFFPYQRTDWGAGRPVGGRLSDFHALVAFENIECDALELLRACGLSSWQFDHLIPTHQSFARFAWSTAESPYIDLADGFDRYLAGRENGRRLMIEYRRKRRKLEQQYGPLRHEPNVRDRSTLKTCVRWKSQQHEQSEADRIFRHAWVNDLLHKILECQGDDFAPALSVTYAGDQIAAIHFAIRSGNVLHGWFPTYNPAFAEFSPGFLHWIETMKAAASVGITRIDLGKGDERYKRRFMSGTVRIAQGVVDLRPSMALARRAWRHTQASIKASPLYGPARVPARVLRRVRSWIELR